MPCGGEEGGELARRRSARGAGSSQSRSRVRRRKVFRESEVRDLPIEERTEQYRVIDCSCGKRFSVARAGHAPVVECPSCQEQIVFGGETQPASIGGPESVGIIEFACESCGRQIRVKSDAAGKEGACPGCRSRVQVPARNESPAIPAPRLPEPRSVGPEDEPSDLGRASSPTRSRVGRTGSRKRPVRAGPESKRPEGGSPDTIRTHVDPACRPLRHRLELRAEEKLHFLAGTNSDVSKILGAAAASYMTWGKSFNVAQTFLVVTDARVGIVAVDKAIGLWGKADG